MHSGDGSMEKETHDNTIKYGKPKMILFDYGQTLVNERKFDGVRGTNAVLQYAICNKYGYTAEDVQAKADAINNDMGRFDPKRRHLLQVEVPNHMFTAYLYQSMGIELSLTSQQIERIFWNEASPGVPTDGIEDFLTFLKVQNIRTGVISNISYCGEVVKERIDTLLPNNDFEFILASSEYMFRKPNVRIFELALEKADLQSKDVWYIGDNYECDILGARTAGLFPVWYLGALEYPIEIEKNDEVLKITHWCELWELLKEIVKAKSV